MIEPAADDVHVDGAGSSAPARVRRAPRPVGSVRGVVLGAALLAAAFVSSPLHLPLNNPNEGVRVFATRALVEHGTTAIDAVVADWGYIDDKATRDGRLYSSKAPLVTLLAAGAYAVVHPLSGDLDRVALTRLCRVAGNVVPTALLVGVAWWALRRRRRDPVLADLAVVGLVTGTGLLASLHVFSGHALVAAAGAALTALALLDEVPSTRRLVGVGLIVSAAACAEYPAALLAPLAWPVLRRHPRRWRALLVLIGAAFVAALPTMAVHAASFGAPWRTGYSFLENAQYRPLVAGTLMGIGAPDLGVLGTALLSPEVGLFFFAPLSAVGVATLPRLPRADRLVVVVVVALFVLFIAGFRGWRGGWSVGPRYLSELWGVLAVVAAVGLEGWRPAVARAALVAVVVAGVVHSGLAGALFPHLPDLLQNPVGELVLPLVVRGVAPDSVPLALGLSPGLSVVVIVVVVALPLVVAVASRAPVSLLGLLVVPLLVAVDLALPGTEPGARGREVRRALDNWRPERGVPYLEDGAHDPRVLFAVDRGRLARNPTCPHEPPRPRRSDIGEGARVLDRARLPDDGLVVVDDALADAIAPRGGGALMVAARDVDVHLRGRLPCVGDIIVVVRAGAPWPASLRALRVVDDEDLGGGWRRRTLARGDGVAP
ncbi:MAG: hypothetical protein FJ137_10925 [Deltaproteobacteria bacterium]|nr:hypothetical protein [Deltaproteobacteria bacterium]